MAELETKKQVVTAFRSKSILKAARAVFARKGFAAAAVDDIAEEAGIAKGTVYLYFRSKDDIYLAALSEELQTLESQTEGRMRAAHGTMEKIRAFAEVRFEYCETHRDFLRIYFSGCNNYSRVPKELEAYYKKQMRLVKSLVAEGVRQDEIRRVPIEPAACAVYDTLRGALERRLLGLSKRTAKQDLELVLDFIWRGLKKAQAETPAPPPRHAS